MQTGDEPELEIDGVRIRYGSPFGVSTADSMFLGKQEGLAQDYLDLMRGAEGNIVEIGIFQGGSAAVTALVGRPDRLVVIDLCDPVSALDTFIADRGLGDIVHPHYRIDQGDRATMARLVQDEFGDAPLDLVIDDASHLYEPTRTSFEVLFPRLRPGCRYLIEDWPWELQYTHLTMGADLDQIVEVVAPTLRNPGDPNHVLAMSTIARLAADPTNTAGVALGRRLADEGIEVRDLGYEPLTKLGFELVALHAVRPDVATTVSFDRHWIEVVRGPAELDPDTFEVRPTSRGVATIVPI